MVLASPWEDPARACKKGASQLLPNWLDRSIYFYLSIYLYCIYLVFETGTQNIIWGSCCSKRFLASESLSTIILPSQGPLDVCNKLKQFDSIYLDIYIYMVQRYSAHLNPNREWEREKEREIYIYIINDTYKTLTEFEKSPLKCGLSWFHQSYPGDW